MSAKQSGQVWELKLPHNEAWVLMALADHADHEGKNVFPGLPLIAWKTGYSQRQVQRILRSLEKQRLIIPVGARSGGRHLVTEYEIHLENGVKKSPLSSGRRATKCQGISPQKGDKMSGERVTSETQKGDIWDHERVTSETQKGDISSNSHDKERARINRHEPSCEPSSRETSARDRETLTEKSSDLEVDLSPVALALCEAVGWLPDTLNSTRRAAVLEAEKEISRHESAVPERIRLAGNYYRAHNKYSFTPKYISGDWQQIEDWLTAKESEGPESNGTYQRTARKSSQSERPGPRAARETFARVRAAFEEAGSDSDLDSNHAPARGNGPDGGR